MAETITYSTQSDKTGKTYFRVQITYTSVGTSQETEIVFPGNRGKHYWHLEDFHIVKTGGTGVNWAPRLGNASGFAADSINEVMGYNTAADSTPIHDMWASPGLPAWTDSHFKLYFAPAFSGSSNHNASVELIFCKG